MIMFYVMAIATVACLIITAGSSQQGLRFYVLSDFELEDY